MGSGKKKKKKKESGRRTLPAEPRDELKKPTIPLVSAQPASDRAPITGPAPTAEAAPSTAPVSGVKGWRRTKLAWAILSGALGVLGGVTAIFALRPRVTLSMTTLPERQPTFVTMFVIRNDGLLPIKYLNPMCYLERVQVGDWRQDSLRTYAPKQYILGPNQEVEVACTKSVIAIWLDMNASLYAEVVVALAYTPGPLPFWGARKYTNARYVAYDDPNDGYAEPLRWKADGSMPNDVVESIYKANALDSDEYFDYPAYDNYPGSPQNDR